MGAKARARAAARAAQGGHGRTSGAATAVTDAEGVPVVGGREICPCGSGRRYKSCHGKAAARAASALVRRPFEGLPGECDWVALREVVPAATATVRLAGEHADRAVTVATILPMALPATIAADGSIRIGLQTTVSSGDPSRDVAHALEQALAAEPGTSVDVGPLPGPGARLQDLLDLSAPFEVTVHEGFGYWLDGLAGADADAMQAAVDAANESVVPTERLTSVEAAYWCRIREKAHLRWVVPHEEDAMLDALARLHAADADTIGPGSRYVGSFRADGLVVPVWDVDVDAPAAALEDPVAVLSGRLAEALAASTSLTEAERRARAVIQTRQVTLR
jgi:hypothetical protein